MKNKYRVVGVFVSGTEFSITVDFEGLKKILNSSDIIYSVNGYVWR